ncbi:MAG: hypothetical protein OEZ43_06875 [Gammaproteobacteria bacterium]|nr:hypothetical protein [Gammaproteobacteria bacterium]
MKNSLLAYLLVLIVAFAPLQSVVASAVHTMPAESEQSHMMHQTAGHGEHAMTGDHSSHVDENCFVNPCDDCTFIGLLLLPQTDAHFAEIAFQPEHHQFIYLSVFEHFRPPRV